MNLPLPRLLATTAWLLAAPLAAAQGFSAFVSPPRITAQVQPGQTLRQVVEIQHVGAQKGLYRVYSNDWTLRPDAAVDFTDELAAESCRPWVAIERRELTIEPGARYRYRFELTPPTGTPARECRFALMIEGMEPARVQGAVSFPVGGRIGVIVYVTVGDAAPALSLAGQGVEQVNGKPLPVLQIANRGNAHGRLEGFVNGTDADGKRIELAPADLPILPGETRRIVLAPVVDTGQTPPAIRYPLAVKGTLEWGSQRLAVDASFNP